MPQIDVTDVLLDPVLAAEPFRVMRQQETVNQYGESVITNTFFNAVGAITPTADNSLVREEGYTTQNKTIQVITMFALRGASKDQAGNSYQPDVVIWKGDTYYVRDLDDYTSYGVGFVRAECIAKWFNVQATR